MKKCYQKKQIERGIDLIEQGNLDSIYNVDLKSVMEWVSEVWCEIAPELIRNCWQKVQLLD